MPLVFERTFRVRHYECDTDGRLHPANFARFMQETALDASADAGYDISRYEEMKRSWLIRESRFSLKRTLTYNDILLVKTWVHDFRRVRSRRAYEFRLAPTNELVAEASTDWIFIDTESERPTAVPPALISAFIPEGNLPQAPRRSKMPQTEPPVNGPFRMRRPVMWRDIDGAGHLNNAAYLAYVEDCQVQMLNHFDWPPSRWHQSGFVLSVKDCRIEYYQPAFLEEELEISAFISEVDANTAVHRYTFKRTKDKTILALAHMTRQCVELHTQKPTLFPPGFVSDLRPNMTLS